MDLDLSPLWISLKTATVATGLAFISGIVAARSMMQWQGRWQGLVDGLLTLPLILPPTVVGFSLLLLLGRNSPLGKFLELAGISIIFSWPAAVIASTVVAFPLVYKTVLGALQQVNPDLLNCARTLGASENRIFWQVLLPLAWPGVVAGTILAFARALGEFGATLMIAGSIPGRTTTMPIAIFFAGEAGRLGEALFWTLLLGGIALSAIVVINRLSDRTLTDDYPWMEQVSEDLQRWTVMASRWLLGTEGQWRSLPSSTSRFLSPKPTSSNPTAPKPASPHSFLAVEIEKCLPGLTIAAQFTTSDRPLGILGASGAGKSTILRCVAGLVTPTQGRIVLNGRVLFDADQTINLPSAERRIGYLFQNYALFPHMPVAGNIGFGLQHLGKEERRDRVNYYLNLLQLQGLEWRYPHQLSGGQQQRVALARVLATNPEVLLLDEPLSALDNHLRSQVEKFLGDLFRTYTGSALLVTHKLEEAYRLCDRLLVIDQGRAIAHGFKTDIFERPPTRIIAQLTECKNIAPAIAVDDHHIRVPLWNNCQLQIAEPLPVPFRYVGIRAHHLRVTATSPMSSLTARPTAMPKELPTNTFSCWLVDSSETQHRTTLYLALGSHRSAISDQNHSPENIDHLQAEVPRDAWLDLKAQPQPWCITLKPQRLILMPE